MCQTLGYAFHLSQNLEISQTFHQNLIDRKILVGMFLDKRDSKHQIT